MYNVVAMIVPDCTTLIDMQNCHRLYDGLEFICFFTRIIRVKDKCEIVEPAFNSEWCD